MVLCHRPTKTKSGHPHSLPHRPVQSTRPAQHALCAPSVHMKRSGLGGVCERLFTYLDIIIDCVAGEVRLRPPVVEVCAVHKAPRALQRSPICATGRGVLSVVPTPACLMGTGNARGGRGSRKAGELATEGRRGGGISMVREGSRRQVGVRACMPAAAGWHCGLVSNDPRAGRTDPSL